MDVLAAKRRVWRIGDRNYPLFSAFGAARYGARWNSPGTEVIYAAESLEGAMLEVRVHTNGLAPPRSHGYIWIDLPKGLSYERLGHRSLKGWRASEAVTREFGDEWARSRRTCLLLVPSAVVPGAYRNVLINPHHPEAVRIVPKARPLALHWDERLFADAP